MFGFSRSSMCIQFFELLYLGSDSSRHPYSRCNRTELSLVPLNLRIHVNEDTAICTSSHRINHLDFALLELLPSQTLWSLHCSSSQNLCNLLSDPLLVTPLLHEIGHCLAGGL